MTRVCISPADKPTKNRVFIGKGRGGITPLFCSFKPPLGASTKPLSDGHGASPCLPITCGITLFALTLRPVVVSVSRSMRGSLGSVTLLCAAVWLWPSESAAQVAANFSARAGSPRRATTLAERINSVDCHADEQWTFTVALAQAAKSPPELWVSTRRGCDVSARAPTPDATCFDVCSATSRRACSVPYGQGAQQYTFTVPARWLVDPVNGECMGNTGRAYLNVIADGAVIAASPTVIRWDLAPPIAPTSLSATQGGTELTAVLTWSYPTIDDTIPPTDSGFDLDTGTLDDTAVVTDTGTPGDTPPATDAGLAFDATIDASVSTPTTESIARFRVLCDPPLSAVTATTSDGGACGTGAFTTLDVNDNAAIAQYECAPAQAPESRTLTLSGLHAGVNYNFAVIAEDLAGNRSAVASSSSCVEGRAITDFWERYHQQGGAGEPGFCTAIPWSAQCPSRGSRSMVVALAFTLAALITRRRNRETHSRR